MAARCTLSDAPALTVLTAELNLINIVLLQGYLSVCILFQGNKGHLLSAKV